MAVDAEWGIETGVVMALNDISVKSAWMKLFLDVAMR